MAQVNIRMDDELKAKADLLFGELGLNMTAAITIFIKAAVRQRGIPFDLNLGTSNSENSTESLKEPIEAEAAEFAMNQ